MAAVGYALSAMARGTQIVAVGDHRDPALTRRPTFGVRYGWARTCATHRNAVDLFCGAGGTSSGLIQAVNELGYDIKLTAINHWDVAIATHTKNHEDVEHFCQSIDTIDPVKIVPGGRLQLLVASPECTHHSNARGGKPRSDQKRADAWLLMRWINNLYVENILIENVKEFQSWGPLTAKGLPDKRYKGQYFQAFIAQLQDQLQRRVPRPELCRLRRSDDTREAVHPRPSRS
jgi:site-specific DNA-cytosine methylase